MSQKSAQMSEESRSERRLATRCWDSAGVCSKAAWDSGAWDPGNMGTLGRAAEGRGVAAVDLNVNLLRPELC